MSTSIPQRRMFCVFLFCLMSSSSWISKTAAQGGWRSGRATYYGLGWSLHNGSCGYGQLDSDRNTGLDVAAISDQHNEYQGSCGGCYEIKCDPGQFTDNYGETLDREDACYDPNRTVIVAIVDSCPCRNPDNAYSNRRWCCGDMDHLDISYHAFEKLAELRWGVIGLQYRPVRCPDPSYLQRKNHYPPNTGRKLSSAAVPFRLHKAADNQDVIVWDNTAAEAATSLVTKA